MHNNYYFLRVLTSQLRKDLIGSKITEVFSQSKNELILYFIKNDSQHFLKAHLSPQFCCLSFPENYSRAKKNSVDLFPDVVGLDVLEIIQIENDRSFYLELDNGCELLFKMHGNRSNIVLFIDKKVREIFKSSLKQDAHIDIESLKKHIDISEQALENVNGDYNKLVPTLGKTFKRYFTSEDYDQSSTLEKHKLLTQLLENLEKPNLYIHYNVDGLPELSLLKIDDNDVRYSSSKEILNTFFSRYIGLHALLKEKAIIRNSINEQLKKADAYIKKTSSRLHQIQHATSYQHFGDLIMANLNQIAPFSTSCKLTDFYTEKEIKIPLKAKLNAQLNAENYYRKAKSQKIEIEKLTQNIEAKNLTKQQLIHELALLEETSDLKRFQKKAAVKNDVVLQDYHSVEIMGYQLMIGKNAVKNDRLTFKIAKKDDLFLHAKDTSGSHVIVQKKGVQNFPKQVIEQAASIAAFYSKSKTESLCSVLYTLRKYVRKAKGAPAGSVIVQREQVILVEPKSIEDILKN